ncbi:MAG TPA: MmgE/PrpD family protein [Syntrophorhabdaceae bacterium]|nr:MmgE/PrpD family protein [Syntrophorhabdaceae bacterium]
MDESLTFAKHVVCITYDDLSQHVVDVTKKSLLDALAVTLAAGTMGEGCRTFVDLALSGAGKKESTIIGFRAKAPSYMAAFANASMSHALDFEDTHDAATVHANAAAIPAALAVAESTGGVSGKDLITAIAIGSDLVCRLGLALTVNAIDYGWYLPPVLEAFGATASAAKLLRLSEREILDAFSLTLCQATCSAEIIYSPTSVVRAIRDAFSAKAAVLSALLAQKKITGFDHPIEGKAGLFSIYVRGNYDPNILTNELGKTFEGANVSFKPWPSCRGTHSCIDAALEMRKTYKIRPSDVETIHLIVSPLNKMLCEPHQSKKSPATAIDAKFSLPFTVAQAIVHGNVSLDSFTAEALADQEVITLAQKISYEVDPALTRTRAVEGTVEIRMKDGATHSETVQLVYGHPENPMSEQAFMAKFSDCAKHAPKKLSKKRVETLVGLILNLEHLDDISLITKYL